MYEGVKIWISLCWVRSSKVNYVSYGLRWIVGVGIGTSCLLPVAKVLAEGAIPLSYAGNLDGLHDRWMTVAVPAFAPVPTLQNVSLLAQSPPKKSGSAASGSQGVTTVKLNWNEGFLPIEAGPGTVKVEILESWLKDKTMVAGGSAQAVFEGRIKCRLSVSKYYPPLIGNETDTCVLPTKHIGKLIVEGEPINRFVGKYADAKFTVTGPFRVLTNGETSEHFPQEMQNRLTTAGQVCTGDSCGNVRLVGPRPTDPGWEDAPFARYRK
jgi:hypothetical protein